MGTANFRNGLAGKAVGVSAGANHGYSVAPDRVVGLTEAVVGQKLQAAGRLVVDIVLSLQVYGPGKVGPAGIVMKDAVGIDGGFYLLRGSGQEIVL